MSSTVSLDVRTQSRNQFVDITEKVRAAVAESGVTDGFALIYVPHTTAGITINENADPSVKSDILGYLARLIPQDSGFRHAEGNSDAHIKASLVGFSQMIPISDGNLTLGTWQGIYFCEFDGPRTRRLLIKITSG